MRPRARSAPSAAFPLLVLLVAVLAGCSGKPAAVPPPEPAAPIAEAAKPLEEYFEFGWAAATGVPNEDVRFLSTAPETFDVGEGIVLLAANVTWACSSPTCDLHAYLCAPGELANADPNPLVDPCAVHAMGGSPLAVQAEAPAAGEWTLYVASAGPTADVAGAINVLGTPAPAA
jgi:hypothetical protein